MNRRPALAKLANIRVLREIGTRDVMTQIEQQMTQRTHTATTRADQMNHRTRTRAFKQVADLL